ncbi:MAG TPA: ATP synthase subunit I [Candidatus Acidoferrum sp.]|nr:ATP synthase subunit I [Candidatus Acidoferrum sp.]
MDERETFVRRTLAGALVVGVAGVVVLLLTGRRAWAGAFGLGAAISLGNFHLIVRAVRGLDRPGPGASRHLWKGTLLRFAIVAAMLVLGVVVLRIDVLALVAGLLVTQGVMVAYWLTWSLRTTE